MNKLIIYKKNNFFSKIVYYIFIILLIFLLFYLLEKKNIINLINKFINIYNLNKLKVCICTVGKLENKYIKEFVEHYRKYKVDKIFLYDNNDVNDENFNSVLSYYIRIKYVEILNYRGVLRKQYKIYQHCYKRNYKKYDWLIFIDIDEYINLKNNINIKTFLYKKQFDNCKSIYLNWLLHTDNNLLYYDNRSLFERFPKVKKINSYCLGKTIIRGNIKRIKINSCHLLDKKIQRCNSFGNNFKPSNIFCKKPDYNYYYIDHFQFKSTEEFINKLKKGDCVYGYNKKYIYRKILTYFKINTITINKINFIQNKTGLNISQLYYKIKK